MEINRLNFLKLALGGLGATLGTALAGPMSLNRSRDLAAELWTRGPEWIEKWKQAPRIPIRESDDAIMRHLLAAMENGKEVRFRYWGGANPGELRRVSPGLLFQCEGFPNAYLSGFCHQRQAERVFQLGLIRFC